MECPKFIGPGDLSVKLIGDAIAKLALPLAFLYATSSIVLASTLATATLTTQLFLTLPLAAIADRLPRRKNR